jgi:hypothetical protein
MVLCVLLCDAGVVYTVAHEHTGDPEAQDDVACLQHLQANRGQPQHVMLGCLCSSLTRTLL